MNRGGDLLKQNMIKTRTMLSSVIIGIAIAIGASIALTFINGIFVNKENYTIDTAEKWQLPIQVLSAFLGCLIGIMIAKENKILTSGVIAIGYYLSLLGVAGLFFNGISSNFWTGFITCTIGSVLAILLKSMDKNKTRRHRHKK